MTVEDLRIIGPDAIWKPLPEPTWAVDGIIREASLTELIAFGGSAKTWMAVSMVVSIATGLPWLGRFDARKGRALFLDYENGDYEIRRRLQRVSRGMGLSGPVEGLGVGVVPRVYLGSEAFLGAAERACEGVQVCVIDTLRAASPGQDENDSNIRAGLDDLRRVSEATGTAFLVLAHAKKQTKDKDLDPREAGRGSSAIFDAADSVIHVQFTGPNEPQVVKQTKARLGRFFQPFEVRVDDVDNDGTVVRAADVGAGETTLRGSAAGYSHQILRLVRSCPGRYSTNALAQEIGARRQTIQQVVGRMADSGELERRDHRLWPTGQDDVGGCFDDLL